jgi:Spy/CpxP family protein refolding chaperone
MKKMLISVIVLIITGAGITAADPPERRISFDKLDLSESQITQIEDLKLVHQKSMIKKRADLKTMELDLRAMMNKKEVDRSKALDLQRQISGKKAELAELRLLHQLEIRQVFTADQLEKWLKMKKRHHRKSPRGHRGESGEFPPMPDRPEPGKRFHR